MYRYIGITFFAILVMGCQSIRKVGTLFSNKDRLEQSFYSSKEVDQLLSSALRYQGVPYRSGGSNDTGMDCSGLLFRVYVENKFSIPRSSLDQSQFGHPVSKNNIQRGDWVLFKTNGSLSINHIGLVLRVNGDHDVQFLHASTSRGVRSDQLYTKYWIKAFVKAIRPYKNNIN